MLKLFIGILIFILGILFFITSIYYGWLCVTPGIEVKLEIKYQTLSKLFIFLSYISFLGGFILIFLSIRKMNKLHRQKNKLDKEKL